MMKKLLLMTMLITCCFDMQAQSTFLKDGRSWEYAYFLDNKKVKMTYFLDGDTIIGDRHCMRLFVKSGSPYYKEDNPYYKAALFEEGQKVYAIQQGVTSPQLLYDFGLQSGSIVTVLGGMEPAVLTVEEVLNVDIGGVSTKVIQYVARQDFKTCGGYWIDGYGNNFPPNLEAVGGFTNYSHAWLYADGGDADVIECLRNGLRKPRMAYRPMLTEGKYWMYEYHHFEDSDDGNNAKEDIYGIKYFLNGDTIISGKTWHKMFSEDEYGNRLYRGAWFEEDRKVWRIVPGNSLEEMVFDFDMMKYEVCHQRDSKYLYFNDVDTISVNGQLYVRHNFKDMDVDVVHRQSYVEGIGGVEGLWPFELVRPTCRCDYSSFVGVYEDGECIFAPEDFGKERYTSGIEQVAGREAMAARGDGAVYDLQGRRVSEKGKVNSEKLPRGVYIQDGKKFVVR